MAPKRTWVGLTLAIVLLAGCGDDSTGPVVPTAGDNDAPAADPSGKNALTKKGLRPSAAASNPSAAAP